MNRPGVLDDDMPAEIDFSGGERGKFYRPNAQLNLPAYSDVNETRRASNLPTPAIALRQGSFFEQSDLGAEVHGCRSARVAVWCEESDAL